MCRWLLALTLLLVITARAQPVSRSEQLLRKLETARTPAEAHPLLEQLARALKEGELFGEEARIARLTRRFWEDPAAPSAVRFQLQEIYGMIAPALAAMEPSLAETLFVHGPLGWLQGKDPERRRFALGVLSLGWEILYGQNLQEVFLQALPAVLASAATWPEEDFEVVMSLLAERMALSTETHLPDGLPPAFVERLRRYRGPHVWYLPRILALDTTAAGTQHLIAFALNPPPLPSEQARWINPQRQREVFLETLENRRLTLEQKRQVVALLAEPELRHAVFRLVRTWWYREEPLPLPTPEMLPLLEAWAIRENCEEAVRLLAAAGLEGLRRLFRMVEEDRRDWNAPIRNPRPCEWDRWSTLFEQAGEIAEEIEAAYRANPAPWHVRLLARAGRWEPVFEALASPNVALRREAAFVLGLALAPEEDELARTGNTGHGRMLATSLAQRPDLLPRVQEALKDEDLAVRREALRALLWLGDETTRPALLAALRMDEENQFQTFLSGFRPKLTDSLALALARIVREDSSGPVRRRAIDLLTRAQPGSWPKVVEGELRPLLGDPEPEVRRAVAGYFATVPAREVATTVALLEATQDASEYVRHFSAMALGLARGWTPELVDRLEVRLREGDPDENVVRGLERAYLHALRREPGSVDRLLAIVLERKGPARWRKALAEGPPADSIVVRALLERLASRPLKDWASMPPKFGLEALQRMIEFFVRAEEDPLPLVLIGHLVPREMLDPWLIRRALEDPNLSLEHRLWLIHQTLEIPADLRENVWRLLMQALREEEGGEMTLALFGRWGFAGVRRLVEERWDEPETLRRVARYLRRQEELGKLRAATGNTGGPHLPKPSDEDLPWIEATLARLVPGTRDPRLAPLVELLGLWDLGNDPALKKATFQTRIPQLLLRHLADPVECRAVAEAVGSLFSRGIVPRCP